MKRLLCLNILLKLFVLYVHRMQYFPMKEIVFLFCISREMKNSNSLAAFRYLSQFFNTFLTSIKTYISINKLFTFKVFTFYGNMLHAKTQIIITLLRSHITSRGKLFNNTNISFLNLKPIWNIHYKLNKNII